MCQSSLSGTTTRLDPMRSRRVLGPMPALKKLNCCRLEKVTMRRKMLWALFCLVLALLPSQTASVAVMSVDLGSEWMKVAIVKPGVPMEIALNKESRRKTPIAVCLKENERLFGDGALGVSVKNPKFVYRYLQSLLGKKHDNPQVAFYQKRFSEHQLVKDASRGTVVFRNSEIMQYSPEELLGMVLNYSRGLAQDFAEQPIKDAVITVPAFFNQAERRAVLQAAQMAGVKVLQLINDNTAVALNYGVFRRKDINSTAQNMMFYDMGSGSTTATIVTYQTVKTKDSGTQPQLQIRGVGFDRSLGGFEMDLRLRDHLAKLFNEQKKTKKDVRENHRAMAKLLKEAQRLKTVLSANAEFMAQVEGLLDEMDFKAKVTRVEFEALCADLFERVPGPVQEALSSAEMSLDEIEQVILVGGSTRVPKVQEVLLKSVGKEELGKNINADEAAAMGAVYQAAALSKAFKVKPFLVREAAVFPIQVEFTRETEDEDGSRSLKHNKRILFQRMAPYPQRKVITFNRYTDDFAFDINYGDLSFLGQNDLSVFGSLNLTTVQLSGVSSSFQKHMDAESKGIKAHFNMDESGMLLLDRVESVFETIVEEKDEESTLTKLGNTISSLFGGGSSEPNANVTEPVQDEEEVPSESGKEQSKEEAAPQEEKQEPGEKQEEEVPTQEKTKGEALDSKADPQEGGKNGVAEEEAKEEEKEAKEAAEEEKEAAAEEKEAAEEEKAAGKEEKDAAAAKKAKPQKRTKFSEDVSVELQVNDILNPSLEAIASSNKKLQDLTDRDLEKQEREKTLNSLEAFIFETQDKMYQEEYQAVVSEEEKETITTKLSEASAWMDEDGYSAVTKELREKLQELRKLCKAMFFRVEERRKWPDHLAALESMLNHSSFFLRSVKLTPEDDQIFTEVELKTLDRVINETITWKNDTVAEQEKRSPTERPVLLSKDIESKLSLLDREVHYLLNKAKFAKPRAKAKANSTVSESSSKANSTVSESSSKANSSKTEEKVIHPKEENKDKEATKVVQPGEEPPTKEPTGQNTDSSSQSQPKDETASTESTEKDQSEKHVGDEL
ncbi:hypoxia up-regulated protein 1 isoform X3 [Oncorhynchus kisutch]|uniref:hypoxia up-regulated protein 1 isoform X2 n=1 Tax=Oncorhynchus kisutch TaxID=8019 RepID=UPI0012DE5AED|nr:hypoxia up-regulated protein 1 isoform X2 [Oncorhynchus kisutch]XP_020320227.2 hypoxia up-regulated protein 1 isoform X3 [Oncorhynchus kisutch]